MSGINFNITDQLPGTLGDDGSIKLDGATASLASDFSVTQAYSNVAGGGMAQVSTLEVTIATRGNERVSISFSGALALAAVADIVYGYQIDSDTPVVVGYNNLTGTQSINFTVLSSPLTSGNHIIKFMASRGLTGGTTIKGTASGAFCNNFLSAVVLA